MRNISKSRKGAQKSKQTERRGSLVQRWRWETQFLPQNIRQQAHHFSEDGMIGGRAGFLTLATFQEHRGFR